MSWRGTQVIAFRAFMLVPWFAACSERACTPSTPVAGNGVRQEDAGPASSPPQASDGGRAEQPVKTLDSTLDDHIDRNPNPNTKANALDAYGVPFPNRDKAP